MPNLGQILSTIKSGAQVAQNNLGSVLGSLSDKAYQTYQNPAQAGFNRYLPGELYNSAQTVGGGLASGAINGVTGLARSAVQLSAANALLPFNGLNYAKSYQQAQNAIPQIPQAHLGSGSIDSQAGAKLYGAAQNLGSMAPYIFTPELRAGEAVPGLIEKAGQALPNAAPYLQAAEPLVKYGANVAGNAMKFGGLNFASTAGQGGTLDQARQAFNQGAQTGAITQIIPGITSEANPFVAAPINAAATYGISRATGQDPTAAAQAAIYSVLGTHGADGTTAPSEATQALSDYYNRTENLLNQPHGQLQGQPASAAFNLFKGNPSDEQIDQAVNAGDSLIRQPDGSWLHVPENQKAAYQAAQNYDPFTEVLNNHSNRGMGKFVNTGNNVYQPVELQSNIADFVKQSQEEQKPRGFAQSVQESPNVSPATQAMVNESYAPKSNTTLEDQGRNLLNTGVDLNTALRGLNNKDQVIAASIKEALAQDAAGNHDASAQLFQNLARAGTESGRTTQAFNLLNSMSPEGLATTAARIIQRYNETAPPKAQLPELTGEQAAKFIADMKAAQSLPEGRDRNLAIQKVQENLSKLTPSSVGDKAFALYRTGLLTALRTPGKVVTSLGVQNAAEAASHVFASGVDNAASLITGKRTQGPQLQGRVEGFNQGIKNGIDYFVHGYEAPGSGAESYDFSKKINFGNSLGGKAAQAYVDIIGRLHGTLPQPFYGAEHASAILDMAKQAAHNGYIKNTPEAITDFVKQATEASLKAEPARYGDISTPEGVAARANYEAAYATNKNQNAISTLGKTANKAPGVKWFNPFAQIGGAITSKGLDYVPVVGQAKELGQQIYEHATNGTNFDQRALVQSIGRLPVGLAASALGLALYKQGKVALAYPSSQKEVAQWQLQGKKENSILIDGKWRSLDSLGPIGAVIAAGGNLAEGLQGNKKTAGSVANAAAKGIAGLGQSVASSPYLQGIYTLVSALQSASGTKVNNFTKSFAKSFVPSGVSTIASATDPNQRVTNNPVDAVRSAIPGLREGLAPQVDVLGQNVPRDEGILGSLFDPLYSSTNRTGPVTDALSQLDQSGNNTTPTKLTANQKIAGQNVTLSPEQLNAYQKSTGQNTNALLTQLINSPAYKNADDATKQAAIQNLVSGTRSQAKTDLALGSNGLINPSKLSNKAQIDLEKAAFDKSGKAYSVSSDGSTVFQRDPQGNVTAIPKVKYDYQLGTATLTQQKNNKDLTGWLQTADKQVKSIDAQLKDPSIDPLEAIKLQNDKQTILNNAAKYQSYGGFTKGSSGRSSSGLPTATSKQMSNIDAQYSLISDQLRKSNNVQGYVQATSQYLQYLQNAQRQATPGSTADYQLQKKIIDAQTNLQKANTTGFGGKVSIPKVKMATGKVRMPKAKLPAARIHKPSGSSFRNTYRVNRPKLHKFTKRG